MEYRIIALSWASYLAVRIDRFASVFGEEEVEIGRFASPYEAERACEIDRVSFLAACQ